MTRISGLSLPRLNHTNHTLGIQQRHFTTTFSILDRHPRAKPHPGPYTEPPPPAPYFPPPDASHSTLSTFTDPSTISLPVSESPLLNFMTNLIMKEGKKLPARKQVVLCLNHLQQITQLPPLPLLHRAIQLSSPLVKLQVEKKSIKSIQVPIALSERQRVRKSFMSILKASERRSPKQLGARLALEVIAVLNGNSETLRQKADMHKLAMVNRSNLRKATTSSRGFRV